MRMLSTLVFTCLALVLLTGSCRRSETTSQPAPTTPPVASPSPAAPAPLRVSTLELGTAVGPDKRVTAPAAAFAPSDTIYVAVATEGGAPGSTITARWMYEGDQLVSEQTETVSAPGAVTEFHIAKPDGWPAGRYRVEIASAGQSLGAREFEVR